MADVYIETAGWIGAILVLSAYSLLTSRKLSGESRTYHGMNLLGAILVGINSIENSAYPSVTINIVWVIVAIYGISQRNMTNKKEQVDCKMTIHTK